MEASRALPEEPDAATILGEAIRHAGHYLPAQGPIAVFVHHNTLHAFEHLPFHRAVVEAGRLYEAAPYLPEARFRELYAEGRIDDSDIEAALREHWSESPPQGAAGVDGRALQRLLLRHSIEALDDCLIRWRTLEGDDLVRPRPDLDEEARRSLLRGHASPKAALSSLWQACQTLLPGSMLGVCATPRPEGWTHRDGLLDSTGEDPNDLVHPILTRFAAAYLDDDSAAWPMPGRESGFFAAWADLVATDAAPLPGWLAGLQDEVLADRYRERGPLAVILDVLADLGLPQDRWEDYLTRLLLHLRGWAGMFRWFEAHPEERISYERQVRLIDFLAVRLVYDRRAWSYLAQKHFRFSGSLRSLESRLREESEARQKQKPGGTNAAAWRLFQLAQLLGWSSGTIEAKGEAASRELMERVDAFDEITRRRLWQEAYERHYRNEILAAVATNLEQPLERRQPRAPVWQIVCCIDEREESFRRHLEECEPNVETFGTAGFFGLPIQYAGLDDGREVPLCPIVVTASHLVHEVPIESHLHLATRRLAVRRRVHRWRYTSRHASRGLVRGILAVPILGTVSALAMPFQTFAPRLSARLRDRAQSWWLPDPATRLVGSMDGDVDSAPARRFVLREQIERVAATLENIGLRDGFARIVGILGHGSESANNPHKSAYDCGACGGRHGGANARLFASFANRQDVREGLSRRGIHIPESTIFVGGIHNTASDAVTLFDTDAVPDSHTEDLERLRTLLDRARAWSAHERCRRFESAPRKLGLRAALRHVEARSESLFEPRAELGHATNAACIVGRRSLSRGLFLDRRSFLVSYDPTQDEDGVVLERTLAAVGPVGAGINLEYYFSFVDRSAYGCGTKLPHNLVGLLGVMDGKISDLRTGLPKQMVEIHEPMRLLLLVEATTATLEAITERQPGIRQLVVNQWVQLVSLCPQDRRMRRWTPGGWELFEEKRRLLPRIGVSVAWYEGHMGPLPPALVVREEVSRAA